MIVVALWVPDCTIFKFYIQIILNIILYYFVKYSYCLATEQPVLGRARRRASWELRAGPRAGDQPTTIPSNSTERTERAASGILDPFARSGQSDSHRTASITCFFFVFLPPGRHMRRRRLETGYHGHYSWPLRGVEFTHTGAQLSGTLIGQRASVLYLCGRVAAWLLYLWLSFPQRFLLPLLLLPHLLFFHFQSERVACDGIYLVFVIYTFRSSDSPSSLAAVTEKKPKQQENIKSPNSTEFLLSRGAVFWLLGIFDILLCSSQFLFWASLLLSNHHVVNLGRFFAFSNPLNAVHGKSV